MRLLAARLALHGALWLLAFVPLAALARRPIFAAALVPSSGRIRFLLAAL
jgi:hypothetical protein